MYGKFAFTREFSISGLESSIESIVKDLSDAEDALRLGGLLDLRIYSEAIGERACAFQYYAVAPESDAEAIWEWVRGHTKALDGWEAARHVYEFPSHPGDGLKTQGIIIGVREGKLAEYIRLHDEQPQIIRDLCYRNGLRKSSIFVADLHKPYLVQFQEFEGSENPELYADETYRNWLEVTGECQVPLPGERFWKPMKLHWQL